MENPIELLTDFFSKKEDILLAFLFGSQAKGKTNKESDYDIAIWPKKEVGEEEINKLWQELELLLHSNVDLILLNKARPTVAWAALRGKKLVIRDFHLFLNLFINISREAEDIQDFLIDYWNLKKRWCSHEPA